MVDNKVYLSVSDLNFYISQKFKNDPYLHKVFLQGELSNFRFRMNSHQYFSLKDEKSKINVVMFRSFFEKLKFKPEEGMKVYVSGYVDVYGPQGSYQFYAQTMEPAGLGALYEQLRQLQEKLAKEGLFNEEHKKKIPLFPDRIAVVTSASGAVIHDIMVTANRRFPHAEIDLYPAKVQGDEAADTIVAALQQIQAQGDKYDVDECMNDIYEYIWSPTLKGRKLTSTQMKLQNLFIKQLASTAKINWNKDSKSLADEDVWESLTTLHHKIGEGHKGCCVSDLERMFNPVAGFEEPMAEYFVPRNQESMCYGYFLRVRDLLNNQKQHADKDTRLHYQLLLHQMNNALNR